MIFTFVIYKVSGGGGLLNNSITIYAEFDHAEGLLKGSNVRYTGVNIGRVTDIELKAGNVLRVSMSLDRDVEKYMKSNAKVDINTNGLVGNMIVNITPGSGDAPLVKEGDLLKRKENIELSDMLGTLSTTNDMISQITESLLQITDKINNGSGAISLLINDETLSKNLKTTTRNLAITTKNIKSSTDSINHMISNVAEGNGNLGYLFKDNSLRTEMAQLSDNLDSLINNRSEPIMKNLELSSEAIANTSKKLESIVEDIESNEGLIGTVMRDTTLTQDLKNTINNLNSGTQKFDESMEALQHHWLLRGFFKKKEKEAKKAKEKK